MPQEREQEVDFSGLSPFVRKKLDQWLAYKKERREPYKATGLQALVSRIRSSVDKYGETAVCDLIDNSMSSGYKGITFDRLQNVKPSSRVQTGIPQPNQWAHDAVRRMLENG